MEENQDQPSRKGDVNTGVKEHGVSRWSAFLFGSRKRKFTTSVVLVAVIVAGIIAIPQARYAAFGLFIKKDVSVVIQDTATKSVVIDAEVTIGDKTAVTNDEGKAIIREVPVGDYVIMIKKRYYSDGEQNYNVPIIGDTKKLEISMDATGRQVPISVTDKISHDLLDNVKITIGDSSAVTDKDGLATVVLPTGKKELTGDLELDGYNKLEVKVVVTEEKDINKFSIVPVGRIYYLSKLTGKINVMSANLDGSDSKIIVKGTGNESDRKTVLLASTDWRYLALSADRDPKISGELYIIDTKSGKMSTMDQGNADFSLVGWSGHKFVYVVDRNDVDYYEPKRQALKSYDAEVEKIVTLDQTQAEGSLSDTYIFGDDVAYVRQQTDGKNQLVVTGVDKSQVKIIKSFNSWVSVEPDGPCELYIQSYDDNTDSYKYYRYMYEDTKAELIDEIDDFGGKYYPTYLISPTGKNVLWHDPRDGKNVILIGDNEGENEKTIARLSDYSTYGWYTDDYILLTKDGSELYIAPSNTLLKDVEPLKITNYHKPAITFSGYGSGYGGL